MKIRYSTEAADEPHVGIFLKDVNNPLPMRGCIVVYLSTVGVLMRNTTTVIIKIFFPRYIRPGTPFGGGGRLYTVPGGSFHSNGHPTIDCRRAVVCYVFSYLHIYPSQVVRRVLASASLKEER